MQEQPAVSPTGKGDPFVLVSISKSNPPEGASGMNWHTYVIAQGRNTIEGQRQGSQSSVTQAVEELVERLNERRLGKSGRTHLTPGPKPKAKAR